MALGDKARAKRAERAQKELPDARVLGIGMASAGPDPRLVVLGAVGIWAGVVVLIAVITRQIVLPGGLVVILVMQAVQKPRYLVRTDRGYAVLKRSTWTGRPSSVVARADPAVLDRPVEGQGKRHRYDFGAELVWVLDRELAAVRAGTGAPAAA